MPPPPPRVRDNTIRSSSRAARAGRLVVGRGLAADARRRPQWGWTAGIRYHYRHSDVVPVQRPNGSGGGSGSGSRGHDRVRRGRRTPLPEQQPSEVQAGRWLCRARAITPHVHGSPVYRRGREHLVAAARRLYRPPVAYTARPSLIPPDRRLPAAYTRATHAWRVTVLRARARSPAASAADDLRPKHLCPRDARRPTVDDILRPSVVKRATRATWPPLRRRRACRHTDGCIGRVRYRSRPVRAMTTCRTPRPAERS